MTGDLEMLDVHCIRCRTLTNGFAGDPGVWPVFVWDGVMNSGKSVVACRNCVDKAFWVERKSFEDYDAWWDHE